MGITMKAIIRIPHKRIHGIRFQAFSRQCFSSQPALAELLHEGPGDDTSFTTDSGADTIPSLPIARRPRLEELRRRLSKDHTPESSISIHKVSKRPNGNSSEASAPPPQMEHEEFQALLRQLDQVPMPDTPLTDRYGRHHSYLRISLSEKCNLRCQYCMPEEGVPLQPSEMLLQNDEILRLATWFRQHGVDKVRLTGGEPLLRKDLVSLVGGLHALDLQQIGMTTNGVTLSKQLPQLVEAGLTHVNISLDSLQPELFAKLTRRPATYFDRVKQAIDDCVEYLPHRTKINCVVLPDNVDELPDFVQLTKELPIDVRFIEYMPFNKNEWETGGFVSYKEMQERLPNLERLQDGPNDTTKWWTLKGDVPAKGRIGFITSMSEHFCGTCNRLRLTSDGKLKVCLFGSKEVPLRDLLRSDHPRQDERLEKLIHYAVQRKHFKLGGHKDMEDLQAHSLENRPMTLIGG